MSEYITLEDSLLDIIFIHSKFAISYEDQDVTFTQIFAKAILKYNELGADYQDTWSKEVWLIYDQLRSRLSKHTTPVKTKKLESDTESSATTRTNVSPATDDAYEDYTPTLKSIDYEARKFKKTTVKEEQMSAKSCEKCIII